MGEETLRKGVNYIIPDILGDNRAITSRLCSTITSGCGAILGGHFIGHVEFRNFPESSASNG